MWNPFKKKPSTFTFPGEMRVSLGKPNTSNWRTGMWVMLQDKVGILHKIDGDVAEVHLVDPKTGDTTLVVPQNLSGLRQCKYAEIPDVRKTGFPPELAKEYGYGD